MSATPPLGDLRVLDISTFVGAPFAAACLAEFGAEVLKIERPGVGDSLRQLGTPSQTGDSYFWLSEARNKKCITLDLKKAQGAELFRRMASKADVVIENFRPGTLEKWGLGFSGLDRTQFPADHAALVSLWRNRSQEPVARLRKNRSGLCRLELSSRHSWTRLPWSQDRPPWLTI